MNSGVSAIDKSLQETNILLKDIAQEFGFGDQKEISYKLLKAVIQTLRDRLSIDEAVEFGSQMPIIVRGIYFEGWNPSFAPIKMDKATFLNEVQNKFNMSTNHSMETLIQGVMLSLSRYVSKGELENIKDNLPHDLSSIINI